MGEEKKRKGIEIQRVDLPKPSQAIDAPIGDEEHNGKQKGEKERNRERLPQPSNPGPFSRLLRRAVIIR